MKKIIRYSLIALIIVLGVFLRFWALSSPGLQGDAGHYSFRALGWFDYMSESGQTTPVIWFQTLPWWANLSFHDHPPLVFIIQHWFFKIFGATTFVAFLPFAFSGVITILALYLFMRKLSSERAALITALTYAVASYAVWGSRTAYLEGVEVLFIVASFGFFALFLKNRTTKAILLWGVATGCALLSKYTSIFLLPAAALYIGIWDRFRTRYRSLWIACVMAVLILMPVIIYNANMFATRGHFDVALSTMLGQINQDYPYQIFDAGFSIRNVLSLWSVLYSNLSFGFFLLCVVSVALLIIVVVKTWKAKNKRTLMLPRFLCVNIGMLWLMFTLGKATDRYASIAIPFLCMAIALAIEYVLGILKKTRWLYILACTMIGAIILIELLYAVNTNLMTRPFGKEGVAYSINRWYDHGYERLDQYLRTHAYGNRPELRQKNRNAPFSFPGQDLIIVDGRLDWFSFMWYFRTNTYYYNIPVITFADLAKAGQRYDVSNSDLNRLLGESSLNAVWFVYNPRGTGVADRADTTNVERLKTELEKSGVKPYVITDYTDTPSIYVYNFKRLD